MNEKFEHILEFWLFLMFFILTKEL